MRKNEGKIKKNFIKNNPAVSGWGIKAE